MRKELSASLLYLLAVGNFLLVPQNCPAQIDPQMPLIRCVDDGVGVSLLCSRDWTVRRSPLAVTWTLIDGPQEKVKISIAKSRESGLTYEDLVPSALQYVYGYADGFRYGTEKVRGRRAVVVEGFLKDDPDVTVKDYFIIDRSDLFRLRFSFSDKENFYRYELLFGKILNSLRFER